MSAQTRLREVEPAPVPFPSAPRAELAALIAQAHEAKRAEAETREALRRANERVKSASRGLEAAHQAIDTAKEAATVRAKASAATGETLVADRSLRDARAAEMDAQDNLDTARAAFQTLEAELKRVELTAALVSQRVAEAAKVVMAEAIPSLLGEAAELQKSLIHRRVQLRELVRGLRVAGPEAEAANRFLRDIDLPGTIGAVEYRDWHTHPAATSVNNYFASLQEDANATFHE